MTPGAPPLARVVVLCGPSGSGKTRLAGRLHAAHGWPVLRLDNFYKDAGDPSLPTSTLGIPDWDDVRSWHLDQAVATLELLAQTGQAQVPGYDISTSRHTAGTTMHVGAAQVIVAEGIFAADVIAPLRERDLLACAICVCQNRWLTFGRRLARDLKERRKPPLVLVRRGLRLVRAEPALVSAHTARGATPLTPRQAERRIVKVTS